MLLHHEGGFVDHPKDPGGMTNLGVTRATLEQYSCLLYTSPSPRDGT